MSLLSMLSLPGPIFSTALPFPAPLGENVETTADLHLLGALLPVANRQGHAAAQRIPGILGAPAAIADGDTLRGDFPRQVEHRLHIAARRDQQLPAVFLPLQLGIDQSAVCGNSRCDQMAVDRQTVRHQRHMKLAHQLHRRLSFHQLRGKVADRQRLPRRRACSVTSLPL
jgi:hypothetical protein